VDIQLVATNCDPVVVFVTVKFAGISPGVLGNVLL
jgi:hypothetical protein